MGGSEPLKRRAKGGKTWGKTLGAKSDFVLLPAGIVKKLIQGLIPNKINRFLTYRFRMGSFLISELEKQK